MRADAPRTASPCEGDECQHVEDSIFIKQHRDDYLALC